MTNQNKIHVLIVDDVAETRENLCKLLAYELGIEVIGTAASGEEAIQLAKELLPDVILMDVNLHGMDGITATEIILRDVPSAQVVMLSIHGEADYLRRAMLAGARDFVPKPCSPDELLSVIYRVHDLGRRLALHHESSACAQSQSPAQADSESDVHFTAYYPREVQVEGRYGLYVYAHVRSSLDAIQEDVQRFIEELGGQTPKPKAAKQSTQLRRDTPVTVVPDCEGLEFDPPSLTKKWNDDWTRFGFDLSAGPDSIGETLFGRISVMVSGVEIAHIKFAVEVVQLQTDIEEAVPDNPLAAAKLDCTTVKMYQRIFVSYSRKDKAVVEAYSLAQTAVGNEVFQDTYSIHSGENWQATLARAIDRADVMQLFWSENSATSQNVCDEWRYALQYKCPETRCTGFIRPVYWLEPMPDPPDELGHLNFRFVPLTATVAGLNPQSPRLATQTTSPLTGNRMGSGRSPGLNAELHHQCRATLLKCSAFDSDDSLRAVFATSELRPFRNRLREASSINERVDTFLELVPDQHLGDGQPVLPLFLKALCDRYDPNDALHNELKKLIPIVQSALTPPTSSSTRSDVK